MSFSINLLVLKFEPVYRSSMDAETFCRDYAHVPCLPAGPTLMGVACIQHRESWVLAVPALDRVLCDLGDCNTAAEVLQRINSAGYVLRYGDRHVHKLVTPTSEGRIPRS